MFRDKQCMKGEQNVKMADYSTLDVQSYVGLHFNDVVSQKSLVGFKDNVLLSNE